MRTLIALIMLAAILAGCAQQAEGGNASGAPAQGVPAAGAAPVANQSPPPGPDADKYVHSAGVRIKDMAFDPALLEIKPDTRVVWLNEDGATHIIRIAGMADSPELAYGQSYTYTFSQPGEYEYSCGLHPSMKGRITVR